MRLSATDIYAFQALGFLGTRERDSWVGSDDISEATGVARPYLVRILATLSGRGIVASKKGTGGGYALDRDAREISLRDVMRAIDGPVAPLSCVSLKWHKGLPRRRPLPRPLQGVAAGSQRYAGGARRGDRRRPGDRLPAGRHLRPVPGPPAEPQRARLQTSPCSSAESQGPGALAAPG